MTYQAPAFMVAHPASLLAIAKFTTRNSTAFTDDSKRSLIDSKQSEAAAFTATTTNAGFAIDFATTSAAGSVNRCVIPAGHNFDGETLQIISDNSGSSLPSPSVRSSASVSGAGIIDRSFGSVPADRYWGLQITTSGAEVFSLSEFWLGNRKALTTNDARVDPGSERDYEHDVTEEDFGGHTVSLELSPPRRRFSLKIRGLDPAQADFAKLDEVIRDGRTNPFWYWTPDSTDTGPYLVKLTRSAVRRQTFTKPMTKLFYEVDLEMLEQL